jgi:hypothetical protein
MLDAGCAVFLVSVDDRFRIGIRFEPVTALFQINLELAKVVNLAVKDDCQIPVATENRLLPGFEVDNRKAAHSERGTTFDQSALFVRTAMPDRAAHRFEQISPLAIRFFIFTDKSDDSAHNNPKVSNSSKFPPKRLF